MPDQKQFNVPGIASYLLAAAALIIVLHFGLLAALFSGLLVYALVHMLTPVMGGNISDHRARMIAVAIIGSLVIALLSVSVWGAVVFFQSDAGSLQGLMRKLADIIEESRDQMPPWMMEHVPERADAIGEMITAWLRAHAVHAQAIGQMAGRTIAHLLVGMVIGAMAALHDAANAPNYRPLAAALHARLVNLHDAFRRIVFAQVRIAGINAIFTGIYLVVVLPLAGVHLPLTKSMIAVTFFAGLLPVIGNLISNSVIVIVGLSHSLGIAMASLVFLIVIHKLEYFLNAKIIGTRINAHAWELLAAMLAMEAVFGLPGIIAAPVFYAYAKQELSDRGLV
ncbi:AI-2E family transporter [Noviherbaspirillum cavernae]|uniref:AI-2E family transporter n=1 Tax=Noviherbaspirillum cavernae TaxID=2320862 RepID=A0A418X5U0_9BURK|nr:AI-2E family transporter [Noviherbaspirillum cavernae]RJG07731.1 AI-2E family transporter [Noviherbaspirillum cavernae]